jgi:hypothetical protein
VIPWFLQQLSIDRAEVWQVHKERSGVLGDAQAGRGTESVGKEHVQRRENWSSASTVTVLKVEQVTPKNGTIQVVTRQWCSRVERPPLDRQPVTKVL